MMTNITKQLLAPKRAIAAAVAALALTSAVHAEPLDSKRLPADSKWVVHIDVEAVTKSETWKLIEPRLAQNPRYAAGLDRVQKIGKLKLPQDLHSVTLVGPSIGEEDALMLVSGAFDQAHLVSLLALNETYKAQTVDGREVHGWEDKGKKLFAGFSGKSIVVGRNADRVSKGLNLLEGKGETLNNDALVNASRNAGVMFYAAGDQVAELARNGPARSPMLRQVEGAWLSIGENEKGLSITSRVTTNDEVAAQNLQKMIEGYKSMISLAAQDDPNSVAASDALADLKVAAEAKTLNIDWSVSIATLSDLLEQATQR